jgi:hypothetical protein
MVRHWPWLMPAAEMFNISVGSHSDSHIEQHLRASALELTRIPRLVPRNIVGFLMLFTRFDVTPIVLIRD